MDITTLNKQVQQESLFLQDLKILDEENLIPSYKFLFVQQRICAC